MVAAARPRGASCWAPGSHQVAEGAPSCCVPFGAAVTNPVTTALGPLRRGRSCRTKSLTLLLSHPLLKADPIIFSFYGRGNRGNKLVFSTTSGVPGLLLLGFTRGTPNDFACCGWVCAHAPGWWQHHGVPCDCPINRALGEINGSGYRAAVLSLLRGASWGKEGAGCLGTARLDREVAPQGTIQSLQPPSSGISHLDQTLTSKPGACEVRRSVICSPGTFQPCCTRDQGFVQAQTRLH